LAGQSQIQNTPAYTPQLLRAEPLGLKRATWMIGTARLLDYIEKHQGGRYARVKVENRLREFWPIWLEPRELRPGMKEHEPS
jgi:hypothetical protein